MGKKGLTSKPLPFDDITATSSYRIEIPSPVEKVISLANLPGVRDFYQDPTEKWIKEQTLKLVWKVAKEKLSEKQFEVFHAYYKLGMHISEFQRYLKKKYNRFVPLGTLYNPLVKAKEKVINAFKSGYYKSKLEGIKREAKLIKLKLEGDTDLKYIYNYVYKRGKVRIQFFLLESPLANNIFFFKNPCTSN